MNWPVIKLRSGSLPIARDATVTLTMPDGTEHDISNYITDLTLSASVDHITKVTLTMVANADIETPAAIALQQTAGAATP